MKEEDAKVAPLRQNVTDYQNSIRHLRSMFDWRVVLMYSISNEERKIVSMNEKIKEVGSANRDLYNMVCFLLLAKQYNREYKTYQNIDRKRLELVNEVHLVGSYYEQLKKLQKEKQDVEIQLEEMGDSETIRQQMSKLNEEIARIKEEVVISNLLQFRKV